LSARRKTDRLLTELAKSPWLAKIQTVEEAVPDLAETSQLVAAARAIAESAEHDLPESERNQLGVLADRLRQIVLGDHLENVKAPPKKFRRIPDDLDALLAVESATPPHDRAIEALEERVPQFAKFSDVARNLAASYDLASEPDEAIRNLLKLAGTTWEDAVAIATASDEGRQTVFLDATKEELKRRLGQAWSQIPLNVRFHLNGTVLTVLMEMQGNDFIKVDQQSDGLRQFVALRSFVAKVASDIPPILLIDEAENHLHYDAQADLVAVLEAQEDAGKAIYTTHSAGCLPRDLGVGVRAIVPVEVEDEGTLKPTDHSRIINDFWFGDHGFSPVLIAMGASAFAFASVQKAMITEGFTDAFLLPSLIREAIGEDRLKYQVVPHFARARANEIKDFDLVASRFVCVVDGDQGGRDHAKFLRRCGLRDEQIFFQGGSEDSGLSLEDFIHPKTYVHVINGLLKKAKAAVEIAPDDLPEIGRSIALSEWLKGKVSSDGEQIVISKPEVVQAVLNERKIRPLLDPAKQDALADLDASVNGFLARGLGEAAN
jgi:hypothetical protein